MKYNHIFTQDKTLHLVGLSRGTTLFIIASKVLSRALNALMKKKEFKCFRMLKEIRKLNHLAFAEDIIIICKAEVRTMQLVTKKLSRYEDISGKKVNKKKSAIYLHNSILEGEAVMDEVTKGILRKEFPFTYLGCPIYL